MLNRGLLIVRPGPGFISWALSVDDLPGPSLDDDDEEDDQETHALEPIAPDPDGEQTAYLVPEFEDDEEAEEVLGHVYRSIFERELEGWCTDRETWPADLSLALFKRWFIIEMHSVVEDLCDSALVDEEPW